ncbi:hypothetical protein FB45DRAFT_1116920 [Roridomyces roridus]|uniref:Novel STAND NTPase 1 domain-containing protein n=1 Tax=Roridomyces roridus TaxID=1738132 RepID=A0AAD7CD48_9AGAR|nr:hypothetical protein FB45DRAFT_1116920 [Roridomyces roridus]
MPPRQPTTSEILTNRTVVSLKAVVPLLDELHDLFGPPFIQSISQTALALVTTLQLSDVLMGICLQLTENIHAISYAIVELYMHADPPGTLPAATMSHVAKFAETMHKIHAFVEAQMDMSRIKHFFRQGEMNALLKDCQVGIQDALDYFKMRSPANFAHDMEDMGNQMDRMHKKLLELVATLSEATTSDGSSSIYHKLNNSEASSKSISMLPARPQIFLGRDAELAAIVRLLRKEHARIAILGAGGMGKTSLARAALHDPSLSERYQHHLYVSCEWASTGIDIAGIIAEHLGLPSGKNLTKAVLRTLAARGSCLLILDNLETTWEPLETRAGVQDLLSLLTDIPHLALIVTMRGAERPSGVRWSRPFLQPLGPLSEEAARTMFSEIADDYHHPTEVNQLLQFADNMPLAIDLMAHLVAYEGCTDVLARLETERTALLSGGRDRRSSLDASIALSLSSARVTSQPGATDLLSLLAILPDGLSDVELGHSALPIDDIFACRTVLLSTSLVYYDNRKRLRSLVPIREYMQRSHPTPPPLTRSLQKHFQTLLELYRTYKGSHQMANLVAAINSNYGNVHRMLQLGLTRLNPDLAEVIICIVILNTFARYTNRGWDFLMDTAEELIEADDHRLRIEFLTEVFNSAFSRKIEGAEALVSEAKSHMQSLNDSLIASRMYTALGNYYNWFTRNAALGLKCFDTSLSLAKEAGDQDLQGSILINPALIRWRAGEYEKGLALAREAYSLGKLCANYYTQANALRVAAMSLQALGNLSQSLVMVVTAREYLKFCGMANGALDLQLRLTEAEGHLQKSEYAEARRVHTEIGLGLSEEQEREDYAYVLMNLALIDVEIGASTEDVVPRLDMAQTFLEGAGHFTGSHIINMILGDLRLRQGNFAAAKKLFRGCLAWGWTAHVDVSSYCLERMADIGRWQPADFDWTSTSVFVYLAFAKKVKQKLAVYKAVCFMGDVFLALDEPATAETLLNIALEAFTSMDVHRSRGDCMIRLGDLAWRRGDKLGAAALWGEAGPLFTLCQRMEDVAKIEKRLAGCENDQIVESSAGRIRSGEHCLKI